jgi:hypothetical protein
MQNQRRTRVDYGEKHRHDRGHRHCKFAGTLLRFWPLAVQTLMSVSTPAHFFIIEAQMISWLWSNFQTGVS